MALWLEETGMGKRCSQSARGHSERAVGEGILDEGFSKHRSKSIRLLA